MLFFYLFFIASLQLANLVAGKDHSVPIGIFAAAPGPEPRETFLWNRNPSDVGVGHMRVERRSPKKDSKSESKDNNNTSNDSLNAKESKKSSDTKSGKDSKKDKSAKKSKEPGNSTKVSKPSQSSSSKNAPAGPKSAKKAQESKAPKDLKDSGKDSKDAKASKDFKGGSDDSKDSKKGSKAEEASKSSRESSKDSSAATASAASEPTGSKESKDTGSSKGKKSSKGDPKEPATSANEADAPTNSSAGRAGASSTGSQTVFWIRHGEKPETGDGLDAQGVARSKCLPDVFGKSSSFNIGKIMAQTPQADGSRQRPVDTVQPLAESLGIKVDTSCDRDDPLCVADAIQNFKGPGNVLVCWEHKAIQANMAALGAKDAPAYPNANFDLIFTQVPPFSKVSQPKSEGCPGIDASKFRLLRREVSAG